MINEARADIVWVGLSTPNRSCGWPAGAPQLSSPVLIGVGAAFDFHSGRKRQAPRWIQRSGFEWLFRLASEPQRLAARYLVTVPTFIFLLCLQKSGLRKFALE